MKYLTFCLLLSITACSPEMMQSFEGHYAPQLTEAQRQRCIYLSGLQRDDYGFLRCVRYVMATGDTP